MELRLQQFIDSVEVLADIRNLDTFNPIVFQLENPVTATRYTVVGSKAEPSYLGIPVNTTWVVLDPQSPYFRMALKLVDVNNPDQETTLPIVVDDTGLIVLYWNIVRTYDEIFAVPQYYTNAGRGPMGPAGPAGADGVVDYNLALATLAGLTGTLEIQGSTTLVANSTQQYNLLLTEPQVLADGTITPPQTSAVIAPIFLLGAVPPGTFMDANNVLHTGNIPADFSIRLYANYPSWTKSALATLDVLLQHVGAVVTGVSMSGPGNVNSGTTAQYTVTATWSDGTTTNPAAVWALDSTSFGTIAPNGALTVPSTITSSGSVNVSATVDIGGITYTPNQTVIITKVVAAATVVSTSISGPGAVDSGTSAQYGIDVLWSDGTTTHPTPVWSINTTAFGTLSSTGLFNSPSTISSSGSATISATFSIGGTTYNPTKTVAVTKIVVPLTVVSVSLIGNANVVSNSSTQYQVAVLWSNGTTTNPAASSWYLDSANFGTISASGVLNVPSSIAASGQVVVTANIDVNGVPYSPTRTVNVTLVVAAIVAPYYGVGSLTQANWPAFITGLTQFPALTVDGKYQVAIDCLGSDSYMYFAYPQAHGEATFYDKLSQFFGGWGGAGSPTAGPSAQTIANYKDMPVTINVDVGGTLTPFYLYRTDFANLGVAAGNQWEVTLATP